MSENERSQPQADERSEGGIPMHDQGPTYSSSYNESTPGEVEENRRTGIHEQESRNEGSFGSTEP